MIVNHQHNFVFVHIPKSGGQSLKKMLNDSLEGCERVSGLYSHAPATQLREAIDAEVFDSYFTFAMVRHPLKRLISFYTFLLDRSRERIEMSKRGEPIKPSITVEESIAEVKLLEEKGPKRWILDISYIPYVFGDDMKKIPQHFWFTDESGKQRVDEVFKLEEIGKMEETLSKRFGKEVKMPWKNTSNSKNQKYNDLLTDPDLIDFVKRHYAEDLAAFDYKIGSE